LLPANTRVLAALMLPTVYAITCATDVGIDPFVERAQRAIAAGVRLIQVREPELSLRDALVRRLLEAAGAAARIVVNGSVDDARRLGCAGVHWTARRLNAATSRPHDLIVGASCHTRAELAHACALDVDFAVMGPVLATPTHPDVHPLGWAGFAVAIERTRVPVFALGGLHGADHDTAITHGAHGIAMRRHVWPA
jgi:8-oxo-dGTP diphosphatase